jgi:hypothetical protein
LGFASALNRVKSDPAYLTRGATSVSWRVGHLAYLEGFCAMEARDWQRAAAMLPRAVELTPADVRPHLWVEGGLTDFPGKKHRRALGPRLHCGFFDRQPECPSAAAEAPPAPTRTRKDL